MTQLLARDLDNDPLVFGVVGEEASRFFAVESMTGVVWLRQPLDREVTNVIFPLNITVLCQNLTHSESEFGERWKLDGDLACALLSSNGQRKELQGDHPFLPS